MKSSSSDNASTNCSKSRASSKNKISHQKPPRVKKGLNINKIGTHNDNFLSSFISCRNEEKGKTSKKSRQFGFNIDEPWFQEIVNLSLDSELEEGEWWAVLRNYVPNIMSDILEKGSIQGGQEISSILTADQPKEEGKEGWSTPRFAEKEKSLPVDSDEEWDKENKI